MLTLYGIPNCSTVKKARAWLDEHGVVHAFVDLRKSPPDRARLDRWIGEVGWERLVNRQGTTWRTLDPSTQRGVSDGASARTLMTQKPTVIRRPVVENGRELVVGFDDEDWSRRFAGPRQSSGVR